MNTRLITLFSINIGPDWHRKLNLFTGFEGIQTNDADFISRDIKHAARRDKEIPLHLKRDLTPPSADRF